MLYKSDSFEVAFIEDAITKKSIAEFKFCVPGSVNKLSQQTLQECGVAFAELSKRDDIQGMVFTSDKIILLSVLIFLNFYLHLIYQNQS